MAKKPQHGPPPADDAPSLGDEAFRAAASSARSAYGRFNLAVVGSTGVGKSSLVNAVFGSERAAVGKGMPVTRGIRYHHDDSLGIWDVEGFEIGTAARPIDTLREHLKAIAEGPVQERISVVWFCVLATADRLTQADIDMIREMDAAGLPVILVLTKVAWTRNPVTGAYRAPDDVEEFRDWLGDPTDAQGRPIALPVRGVALTSTRARHGKGAGPGLGDLVAQTLALSPEDDKDAFRIAQRLNLPWKRQMARPVIAQAASAAAAAAAIPIPVADATALAPIQLAMMGRIATIYDLRLRAMLSASAVTQLATQITGQALARSFLKLIPGAGSVVNASIAAALTTATGEGWRRLCENVHTGKLDPSAVAGAWASYTPTVMSTLQHVVTRRRTP